MVKVCFEVEIYDVILRKFIVKSVKENVNVSKTFKDFCDETYFIYRPLME